MDRNFTVKRGYIQIPEGQIHYRFAGNGDPILLLHQTPESSDEYNDVIPFLAAKHLVIAPDNLGYGYSDKPPHSGYSIENYVENTVHFLDALGIPTASVIGHLTGATLAIELAASYPERVNKLVLFQVSLYNPSEQRTRAINPNQGFHNLTIDREGSFIQDVWSYLRGVKSPPLASEFVYRKFLGYSLAGNSLHDAHIAAFKYDKTQKLALIKSPTLLISGDGDIFFDKIESVKSIIPSCTICSLEGAQYAIVFENPEKFANIILDFLYTDGN